MTENCHDEIRVETLKEIRELIENKPKLVTTEWVKMVALDISTRTFYDADDHKQGKIPMAEYPGVEKALIKWLEQLGAKLEK